SSFFRSKITVLSFYSSSCRPCRVELEFLFELESKIKEKELQVLVVTSDTDKKTRNLIDRVKVNKFHNDASHSSAPAFNFVIDRKNRIRNLFTVQGIPATFIIDRAGVVKDFILGYPPEKNAIFEAYFQEKINKLLQ